MSNGGQHPGFRHSSHRQHVYSKELVMIVSGVTGFAILVALLQVFLLPIARAQSSDAGANYTSPGVYPARIFNLYHQLIVSNWRRVRAMG